MYPYLQPRSRRAPASAARPHGRKSSASEACRDLYDERKATAQYERLLSEAASIVPGASEAEQRSDFHAVDLHRRALRRRATGCLGEPASRAAREALQPSRGLAAAPGEGVAAILRLRESCGAQTKGETRSSTIGRRDRGRLRVRRLFFSFFLFLSFFFDADP